MHHVFASTPMFCRPQPLAKSLSLHTRLVSTKRSLPFPSCRNPAPHEIFHLSPGASQDEIKARYYELVKLYHPDAAHGQHDVPPSMRNARFRAITHAYGILRGRNVAGSKAGMGSWDYYESRDGAMRAELRRRSRRSGYASASTSTTTEDPIDDSQLRYTLMAFMLAAVVLVMNAVSSNMDRVEQHSQSAAANLAQARADARVDGLERRRMIRERVRSFQEERDTVGGSEHPGVQDVSEGR